MKKTGILLLAIFFLAWPSISHSEGFFYKSDYGVMQPVITHGQPGTFPLMNTLPYPQITSTPKPINRAMPNEAGEILILTYHGFDESYTPYNRSYKSFISDLITLYEKGYRAVSLDDYARGNIDVERGCKPFVLTFDDANASNFTFDDKPSAVTMMERVQNRFHLPSYAATFFLTGNLPYYGDQQKDYLRGIVDNGHHIGNHTLNHFHLREAPKDMIAVEINAVDDLIKNKLTPITTEISAIAIPYNERLHYQSSYDALFSGNAKGMTYRYIANGVNRPGLSPHKAHFDPRDINRVSGEFQLRSWLRYFETYPEKAYISDGDPNTITVPKQALKHLSPFMTNKRIFTY